MLCILVPINRRIHKKTTKAQKTTKGPKELSDELTSALWSMLASLATVLSTRLSGSFPAAASSCFQHKPAAHWQQTVGDPLVNIVERLAAMEPAISHLKPEREVSLCLMDVFLRYCLPTFLLYQFYKLSVLCFMVCCTTSSWWKGIVNIFLECISGADG